MTNDKQQTANKATNNETFMKKCLILIINEIDEQQQK
jgi:hypothetical protein